MERLADAMMRGGAVVRSMRRRQTAVVPGLEQGHLRVLDVLADGPLRVGELATALQLELPTVSRRVTRLVELGLVAKVAGQTDRRVQVTGLTDEGHRAIERMREQRRQVVDEILQDWSEAELAELARLLEKLADGVDA